MKPVPAPLPHARATLGTTSEGPGPITERLSDWKNGTDTSHGDTDLESSQNHPGITPGGVLAVDVQIENFPFAAVVFEHLKDRHHQCTGSQGQTGLPAYLRSTWKLPAAAETEMSHDHMESEGCLTHASGESH